MGERSARLGHLPLGVQDLFLEEAARRRQAEATLRRLFSCWAYHEVIPPTFEYEDNLAVGADPGLRQAMYRFFGQDGHTLALRADFTTQIARIAAGRLSSHPLPLRCFYVGSVFRREEPQVGHQREFTQAGVELIGASTAAADAEVVALAVTALDALDVTGFQVNLGQMALFRALTAGLPIDDLERIRQALDRRNVDQLAEALEIARLTGRPRDLLGRLPDLVGGPEILEEALHCGGGIAEAAAALGQVYRLLRAYGLADRIILDLGEVRGMEYYTGITFRGLAPGLGWPVLSGGRYDELLGRFGRGLAAVGFGLGIERALLVQAASLPTIAPHLVMAGCDHPQCLALARRLRGEGFAVQVDVLKHSADELLAYAFGQGARYSLQCQGEGAFWLLRSMEQERWLAADELLEEVKTWTL